MKDINAIIRSEFNTNHKIEGNTLLESLGGSIGRSLMASELERIFIIEITGEELRNLKSVNDVHLMVIEKTAQFGRFNRLSTTTPIHMHGYASATSGW